MSAPTEVEFLRAEVAHWKAEYERLATTVANIEKAAQAAHWASATPPEPPVGTRFTEGDVAVWERTKGGWFCARVDCPHCPAAWAETYGYLTAHAERILPNTESEQVV